MVLPLPVGFGLWKVPATDAAHTVYTAIKNGYRLFDAAADYGQERQCGDGLKKAIDEGIVTREEVYITSKLWNTNHAKNRVEEACRKQLADWQTDYFDAYLIHFPIALAYVDPKVRYPAEWWDGTPNGPVTLEDSPLHLTWEGMEDLHRLGLVKEIGISNFNGSLLIDLNRYAKIKPTILQIEHHPYLTQERLISLAKRLNLAVTAYSSFGPQSFLELQHPGALKAESLLSHPTITKIAKSHNKTNAAVLLRWSTQRGISVIPKSNNYQRAMENLENVKFDLTEADLKEISGLNINLRFNSPVGISEDLDIFC